MSIEEAVSFIVKAVRLESILINIAMKMLTLQRIMMISSRGRTTVVQCARKRRRRKKNENSTNLYAYNVGHIDSSL